MQGISKQLAMLRLFQTGRPEWKIGDIQKTMKITADQTRRYLEQLAHEGLVHSYTADAYVLGPAVNELYNIFYSTDPFSKACLRASYELMQESHLHYRDNPTILVCGLYRDTILCIHRFGAVPEGHKSLLVNGFRLGLTDGAGPMVIQAHLSPDRISRLYANHKAVTGKRLKRIPEIHLEKIRDDGFAFWNVSNKHRMREIAAPVFGPDNTIVGCLVRRISVQKCPEGVPDDLLVTKLVEAAARASAYFQAKRRDGFSVEIDRPSSPAEIAKAEESHQRLIKDMERFGMLSPKAVDNASENS